MKYKNPLKNTRQNIRIAQSLMGGVERSEDLINLLQEALRAEFQQWDLYYAYKTELIGLSREPIEEHFADHAEEEAEHIDILQRYLVTMGIQPTKSRESIPTLQNPSMEEIISLQLKFELLAIETYKKILQLVEEVDPLKIEIENILAVETEHAQDLQLLLGKSK